MLLMEMFEKYWTDFKNKIDLNKNIMLELMNKLTLAFFFRKDTNNDR